MKANAYAFLDRNGEVDLDSIAETQDGVRLRCLRESMGWRFDHPDRYSHEKEWERLLTYGSVVPICVSVLVDAKNHCPLNRDKCNNGCFYPYECAEPSGSGNGQD